MLGDAIVTLQIVVEVTLSCTSRTRCCMCVCMTENPSLFTSCGPEGLSTTWKILPQIYKKTVAVVHLYSVQ